jgi:Tfp pilus assembly protein PilX
MLDKAPMTAEAAEAAARDEEARILNAVYSPALEAERKERESFYMDLGVPPADARRLVARILAAYAPLDSRYRIL